MSYHRVKCGLCVATVSLSLAACSDVPSTSMAEKGALTETVFAPTLPNAKASSATLVRQSLARIDAIDRDGPTLHAMGQFSLGSFRKWLVICARTSA